MIEIQIDPKSNLTGVFVKAGVKLQRGQTVMVEADDPVLEMDGIMVLDPPVELKPPVEKVVKKVAKKKAKKKGG